MWQLMVSAGGDFTTNPVQGPGVCRGTPPEASGTEAHEGNNVKPLVIAAPVQQLTPDPGEASEAFGELKAKNLQPVRSEQHKNRPILDVEGTQSEGGEEWTASKPKNRLTKAQNDITGGSPNAWDAWDGCCTLLALSLWG